MLTLDMDFSNVLNYPPSGTEGVIVLRPGRLQLNMIKTLFEQLIIYMRSESPVGALWIIEPGRLRVYKPEE